MRGSPLLLASLLFLLSCQPERDEFIPQTNDVLTEQAPPVTAFLNVHEVMRPYFIRFEAEANARGITFADDIKQLETQFEHIDEGDVIGYCHWSSHSPNLVSLDIPFWNQADDADREFLVFHELGHCILYRDHTESATTQNVCRSLMASGTGNCYLAYENNREYYIDELFFPGDN